MATELVEEFVPSERMRLARIAFLTHREFRAAGAHELGQEEFMRYWHLKSTIGDSCFVVRIYPDGRKETTGLRPRELPDRPSCLPVPK